MPHLTSRSGESISDRIEHDIHLGELAPGSWLKQVDLERRYGSSRAAIRQGLDVLVSRHLVAHEPNCGYRVVAFDPQTLHDVSQIRAVLEVAAAEQVFAQFRPAHAPKLRRLAERFAASLETGDLAGQHEANQAFHQALLTHCPNKELVALITVLRRRIPPAVQRRKNPPARMQAAAAAHFAMLDALLARDLDRLRQITRDHVLEPPAAPRPAKARSPA